MHVRAIEAAGRHLRQHCTTHWHEQQLAALGHAPELQQAFTDQKNSLQRAIQASSIISKTPSCAESAGGGSCCVCVASCQGSSKQQRTPQNQLADRQLQSTQSYYIFTYTHPSCPHPRIIVDILTPCDHIGGREDGTCMLGALVVSCATHHVHSIWHIMMACSTRGRLTVITSSSPSGQGWQVGIVALRYMPALQALHSTALLLLTFCGCAS